MRRSVRNTFVAAVLVATGAQADPTVGFGFNYVFGEGPAIGFKLFTDNKEDSTAGYVGFDYVFRRDAVRPHMGIGYLGQDWYLGVDIGLTGEAARPDFAIGAGLADTEAPPKPRRQTNTTNNGGTGGTGNGNGNGGTGGEDGGEETASDDVCYYYEEDCAPGQPVIGPDGEVVEKFVLRF